MMISRYFLLAFVCTAIGCSQQSSQENLATISSVSPSINGKTQYLASPYVTAGNRVYMVGHQDGSFPDLGWHIKGEMGGIWNHPIKLFDGFTASIEKNADLHFLNKATQFTNYPYANSHRFDLSAIDLNVSRYQFVPDDKEGILVQYIIENTSKQPSDITFSFSVDSDLRPTWLGERTGMINAKDSAHFDAKSNSMHFKDLNNSWYAVAGSDLPIYTNSHNKPRNTAYGANGIMRYKLTLAPSEVKTLSFVLAGSYKNEQEALATYQDIHANWKDYARSKRNRYKILASQSKLTTPDSVLNQTFEWLKYNSDWLVREVPEIGSGITAGIPDYPWWFGVDSEYALKGYMTVGQTAAVYNTISLLDSMSQVTNGNGRIIHEMSTNGAVYNPGNINETPQFASLIWEVYKWNGDKAFLEKYFPTIEKGMDWLLTENDKNKNMFPDGFGMMEIHGMDSEMIDVAAYTQRALDDAASISQELGKSQKAISYKASADTLSKLINQQFWSEQFNSYADFIGTDAQALSLIKDAIVRADTLNKPWAIAELKQTQQAILENPSNEPRPFVLHHNWVVNTPMEMKIAPKDKAIAALNTAQNFVNPFGVFVTGIDRDESAGSDEGSFKGSKVFSYTGAPTAVQIVSENNYGRPDNALNYLNRMTRSFSYAFPGSMYEVSPDYGMITQAWNIYGYGVPIVQQFFGIQPFAAKKQITISPQLPTSWDKASIENVLVGDGQNAVSIFYTKKGNKTTIRIEQTNDAWELILKIPSLENTIYTTKTVGYNKAQGGFEVLKSKNKTLELTIETQQ